MGKITKKINIQQMKWGIFAGIITAGLMLISYKVGLDQGRKNSNNKEDSIIGQVENREVFIEAKTDCVDFKEEVVVEENRNLKRYCIEFHQDENAYEMLKRLDDSREDFSFDFEESEFGIFITSINNYHPDIASEFWAFIINGQTSQVGVKDYKVNENDVLNFKIEEIIF